MKNLLFILFLLVMENTAFGQFSQEPLPYAFDALEPESAPGPTQSPQPKAHQKRPTVPNGPQS